MLNNARSRGKLITINPITYGNDFLHEGLVCANFGLLQWRDCSPDPGN